MKNLKLWIILGVIVLFVFILYGSIKGTYNGMVSLNEDVSTSWSQVVTDYQRRMDLRIFANRKLSNCIIVDNLAISFKEQLDNGIFISSFMGEKQDGELVKLLHCLLRIKDCEDVRIPLRDLLFMRELYEECMDTVQVKK